jgi:hypothetical protein
MKGWPRSAHPYRKPLQQHDLIVELAARRFRSSLRFGAESFGQRCERAKLAVETEAFAAIFTLITIQRLAEFA